MAEDVLREYKRDGLLIAKTAHPEDEGAPGCWLGGKPTLPPDLKWPYVDFEGVRIPLHFMAQINLAEVPDCEWSFPRVGTLFFFFDPVVAPGLSMNMGSQVIHVTDDVSGCEPRSMPPLPDTYEPFTPDRTAIPPNGHYRQWNFMFSAYETYDIPGGRSEFWSQATSRVLDIYARLEREDTKRIRKVAAKHHVRAKSSRHRMFGDRDLDLVEADDVPLLSLEFHERDVGFEGLFDGIVWWIKQSDLSRGDFTATKATEVM